MNEVIKVDEIRPKLKTNWTYIKVKKVGIITHKIVGNISFKTSFDFIIRIVSKQEIKKRRIKIILGKTNPSDGSIKE